KAAKFLVMSDIELKISGMTCQNCVRHVKEAISEVSGIKSVEVSLETATAKISSDTAPDLNALTTAIQAAGYSISNT
ncbi:MAG: heavy metal-associated domain-containing protein, partial [Actinomycetota bacterium]|nr:heavy metal-associated domain-containing protein [Actinomycetota bacterium]